MTRQELAKIAVLNMFHAARYSALYAIACALVLDGADGEEIEADYSDDFADASAQFAVSANNFLMISDRAEDWEARSELERLRDIIAHNVRIVELDDLLDDDTAAFIAMPIIVHTVAEAVQ